LLDLLYIAIVVAFFGAAALLVRGCSWIIAPKPLGRDASESRAAWLPGEEGDEAEPEELPLNREPES